MGTPFLDDLEAVLLAAVRGAWYEPAGPAGALVLEALGADDPRFPEWFDHAEALRGQLAVARVLLGLDIQPRPEDLTREEPGLGPVFAARVRDVVQWRRFDPWRVAVEYRLVSRGRVTRMGSLFLAFSERERKALLQAVGAELADGYGDRWHLSAAALHTLARQPVRFEPQLHDRWNGWDVADALGLVHSEDLGSETEYRAARPAPDPADPLTAVVRSLLDDERAEILGGSPRSDEVLAPFVHGMRNRMRPLENAVQRIRATAPSPEFLAWVAPLVDDVERRLRGLDDVVERLSAPLGFVTTGAPTLRAAVLEAVRTFEVENGMDVDVADGPDLALTLPPPLLTEALLELLRNAREAGATSARVAWVERPGGGAEVVVSNDGPAIARPATDVFEPGVSTRGPGRGNGLAHLRDGLTRHGATLSLADTERVTFVVRTPGRA